MEELGGFFASSPNGANGVNLLPGWVERLRGPDRDAEAAAGGFRFFHKSVASWFAFYSPYY